jgi:hypothetical protein
LVIVIFPNISSLANRGKQYHRNRDERRPAMDKPWSKPVALALEGPGVYTTISTPQQASWAMIEDWPLEDGTALDRALEVCAEVAAGRKSAEDARRAFLSAAAEAGIHVRE